MKDSAINLRNLVRLAFAACFLLSGLGSALAENTNRVEVTCDVAEFTSLEGWQAEGGDGNSFSGNEWKFQFAGNNSSVAIRPTDRAILIPPRQCRLRVAGSSQGHPLEIAFYTHFMTFHKTLSPVSGAGEHELVFDAPPGEGWRWEGGENDGKIHGPLRLAEIRLAGNGTTNTGRLQMIRLTALGQVPANQLCSLTADMLGRPKDRAFRVTIRGLSRDNLYGELNWVVRDWAKRELERGSKRVYLPILGGAAVLDIACKALKAPLQFAEAEFEMRAEDQQPCRALAYWLNPPETKGDTQLRPESPFGMGVYLCRYSFEDMETVAQRAQEAGVKWSREDFGWERIEPRPGQFNWEYPDRLLDCARRHGITVYPILAYFPSWSKGYTTEGIDQYVQFLRAVVTRYHGQLKQWEIWNEPNIFFWQGTKEQYAELLTKSYRAIKEIDPEAQVLGLSTSGIDYEYIQWMLQHQTPFDVLTIHPYRTGFDDAEFIADLKKASDLVRMPDGKRRPVWLTELGWATHTEHPYMKQDFKANPQRTQAELIARVYLSAIASGVEPRTFWYDFRNDGADPYYFEHNLGILRHDNRPKAAFVAYRTMTSLLTGLGYQSPVEASPGILAYRFVDPRQSGRNVIAAWSPKTDATAEFKVPDKRVKVANTMGEISEFETTAIAAEKKLRRLRLELKAGAVVYILNGSH